MPPAPVPTPAKLPRPLWLPLIFAIGLALPLVQTVYPLFPELPNTDNRVLVERPLLKDFPLDQWHKFLPACEKYFNDHFGFRNYLIRFNNFLHVRVFSLSPIDRMVVGQKGWWYFNFAIDGMNLSDYQGLTPFTASELQQLSQNLTRFAEFFHQRKIVFLLVIAPNKHTIYPEFLPPYFQRGRTTRLDQLMELCRLQGFDFVLDLSVPLLAQKPNYPYPLYYRTDTHWNPMGAFLAYQAIARTLAPKLPAMRVLHAEDMNITVQTGPSLGDHGDLSMFLNCRGWFQDTLPAVRPLRPKQATELPLEYPFRTKTVAGVNPLKAFVRPNGRSVRLLSFRDSFSEGLIPFLSESFSRSAFVWSNLFDPRIVEAERPDVVIFEVVERYLGGLLTQPMLQPEARP